MFGFTIVSKRYVEYLEKEQTYWRTRFEAEQARADRIADQLLQERGALPATEAAIAKEEAAQKRLAKLGEQREKELVELFADAVEENKDKIDESDELHGLSEGIAELLQKK